MSNSLDLSTLTRRQLMDLAWDLRGTPAVQPVYQELGSRPPKTMIHPSDPDWERKSQEALKRAMGIYPVEHSPDPDR